MCDPVTAMVVSAVGSVAAGGISYMQQQDVMNKQNQANSDWIAWQKDQANQMWQKEDAARAKAETAQQDTLQKLSPDQQKAQQATEQARLQTVLTPASSQTVTPTNAGDYLMSGQKNASNADVSDISARINSAVQAARQRIAALATVQSYGDSPGGLSQYAQQALQKGGQDIALQGDIRQGNLAAYGVAKNVEPIKYQSTPSPWGSIATSLASVAGSGFGNLMSGNVKMPVASV